jgi:hypothetical protein
LSRIVTDGVGAGRAFGRSPFPLFAKWESAMTILEDTAIETAPLLPLAPSEPRALIAILSTAKRNALVACFNANGLHKKDGAWHGPSDGKPVSGVTVADLARDGMLTLTTDHRLGSARLTERGNWFARTLLHDAIAAK